MAEKFRSKIGNSYAKKDIEDWQPRLKADLATLKRQIGNRQCCDCGNADVTWASPKLGTFLCVTCSDIHRAAGAHITCVKNFSTYLWSPDEVEMMRIVGNRRAKELYRRTDDPMSLSWQPEDSKDRKVKLCTQIYGSEAVQRAVQQNIASATAAANGSAAVGEHGERTAGYAAPAPAAPAKKTQDSPNWLDDWTEVTSGGDLLDWPSEPLKPLSPVVQRGDGQPLVAPVPASKPQEDLADIFPATCGSQAVRTLGEASERRQRLAVPSPGEKDFWDSVNWDDLLG